jgi:Trk K+ transport system NAD-binding subunit
MLRIFERKAPRESGYEYQAVGSDYDVIIFGIGRYGGTMGRRLSERGRKVLGVDFSPVAVRRWRNDGLNAAFGDVADPEFISTLPLSSARWVISTIREGHEGVNHSDPRIVLMQGLRDAGYEGRVAVASMRVQDFDMLKVAGADLVLEPFHDAADRAVELLEVEEFSDKRASLELEDQREFWR